MRARPRRANEPLIEPAVERILGARRRVRGDRGVLVALTGIDGSGKGHVAAKVLAALEAASLRVARIGVDGWLNLPHVRFDASNPAEHFYERAIRFDEMFDNLVLPLRNRRSLRLEADQTVYFPAQRLHFARDRPRAAANAIIRNDPALGEVALRPILR